MKLPAIWRFCVRIEKLCMKFICRLWIYNIFGCFELSWNWICSNLPPAKYIVCAWSCTLSILVQMFMFAALRARWNERKCSHLWWPKLRTLNNPFDLGQIISLLGRVPIHSIADEAFFSFLFWFEKNLSLVSSSSKKLCSRCANLFGCGTGRAAEHPKKLKCRDD